MITGTAYIITAASGMKKQRHFYMQEQKFCSRRIEQLTFFVILYYNSNNRSWRVRLWLYVTKNCSIF